MKQIALGLILMASACSSGGGSAPMPVPARSAAPVASATPAVGQP